MTYVTRDRWSPIPSYTSNGANVSDEEACFYGGGGPLPPDRPGVPGGEDWPTDRCKWCSETIWFHPRHHRWVHVDAWQVGMDAEEKLGHKAEPAGAPPTGPGPEWLDNPVVDGGVDGLDLPATLRRVHEGLEHVYGPAFWHSGREGHQPGGQEGP